MWHFKYHWSHFSQKLKQVCTLSAWNISTFHYILLLHIVVCIQKCAKRCNLMIWNCITIFILCFGSGLGGLFLLFFTLQFFLLPPLICTYSPKFTYFYTCLYNPSYSKSYTHSNFTLSPSLTNGGIFKSNNRMESANSERKKGKIGCIWKINWNNTIFEMRFVFST